MADAYPTGSSGQSDTLSRETDGCRHLQDPEDMTPEERLDRIVEILAVASVRLAQKESGRPAALPTEKGLDCSPNS